jgi:hypothetical protein
MCSSVELYKFLSTVFSLVTNRLKFPDSALYIIPIHTLSEFRPSFTAQTSKCFPYNIFQCYVCKNSDFHVRSCISLLFQRPSYNSRHPDCNNMYRFVVVLSNSYGALQNTICEGRPDVIHLIIRLFSLLTLRCSDDKY